MFAFTKYPLARQFMLVSLLILVAGMLIIGIWISRQIEQGVLNRTAAITALYVDSFVSPRLQALTDGQQLPDEMLAELDSLLSDTALGQQIASFKVWSPTGRILYSPNPELIGSQFGIEDDLSRALDGDVNSELTRLDRPEHEYERQFWDELIETYAPVRADGGDEVIAVSEFYQRPDDLAAEIRTAQIRSWLVVGVATLIMYLLLAGMVGRASDTILHQQSELEEQVTQMQRLLEQNEQLHARVRRAAARTTALNERFLRRISADLHDGPGQDMALALMQIEPLCEDAINDSQPVAVAQVEADDLCLIRTSIDAALKDLRAISVGLRLPEVTDLAPADIVLRAVHEFRNKTGSSVSLQVDEAPTVAPVPAKITLYRVLQEALANSYHHAGEADRWVKVWEENARMNATVGDTGNGFDPDAAVNAGRLGLVGMRERVELLGGTFNINSGPAQGTRISVTIPLEDIATVA